VRPDPVHARGSPRRVPPRRPGPAAHGASTLAHRIILRPEAELQGRSPAEVVARALQAVPVPRTVLR
jgi:hypothetical protein